MMNSTRFLVLAAFLLLFAAPKVFAESVFSLDIATCRGSSEGVVMTFDVFQEFSAQSSKPTGKGNYVYIMGSAPDDNKNLGVASVTVAAKGERVVQLFTILDSKQKFGTLTVPAVEGIDSKEFKARFVETDFECVAR